MNAKSSALLFAFLLPAYAQIAAPRIGCFVDERARLRFVDGVAGSFIISAPQREAVVSAACFEGLVLVKLEASLEVNGKVFPAPHGRAEFREGGFVHYVETGEWYRARDGALEHAEPANRELRSLSPDLRVEHLGPGWLRIVLKDGRHLALALDGLRLYRLPEVDE